MTLGATPQEAARRARLAFGGLDQVKEESRDSRGVSTLDSLFGDLRYSFRVLLKSPAFTSVAVLSLALGIGANTAIFQLLDAVRLRALPVRNSQELAQVRIPDMSRARGSHNRADSVTYPIWEQIGNQQQAFSGVFAWADGSFNLSPSGEVRMVPGLWVSGEFFQVLGVEPALGRLFTPADDHRGCGTPGAVISYSFWQSEFGGESSAIGRKLTLNGHPVEVIGVTPAGFFGLTVGQNFQVALPLCSIQVMWFNALDAGTFWWLTVMGRLGPGGSIERAAAQVNAMSAAVFETSLPPGYPPVSVKDYLGMKLTATSAQTGISGLREDYSDPLWLLLAIAGLVLLIACANLANLMLARASARAREIALRLAIGAPRSRIIRQLMSESLVVAATGAGLGLLLSRWLSQVLVAMLARDGGSIFLDLNPDGRVLSFTAGLAVLTCALFGLAPALRSAGANPGEVLKAGRGMTASRERFGLRRMLVVSQVALSLVLLVGALLFVRSLRNLATTEAGFRQEGILIADLGFARPNPSEVQVLSFQKALLEHVRSVPGVVSVADTNVVPISGNASGNKVWMDHATSAQGRGSYYSRVSNGYFRTLDTPLLAGRDFDDHDTLASPKVAIVNEAFARQLANGANPVGQRFWVEATPSTPETAYEIVGLVRSAKYLSLRQAFQPVFYLPYSQDPHPQLGDQLLIRSNAPLETLLPAVRRALAEVDPNARYEFGEFKTLIRDSLLRERLMATLSSSFGLLAGVLSAIGLYGVISYLVARRRNEIGIRMALGADRREILTMVLKESGRLLTAGLAAGTVLSLGAARFASTLLFGLTPYDGATLVTAVVILAAVALAASYLPARRAARLDPVVALRDE
ncbi:MAG: ABC transporter permease [Acidobacteriia bacterium]|nr:ABC transporter permease [Terriglobia bacterium]